MSLSNILFTDVDQALIVNKQKAELYMQMYQYMAEDFFTVADANIYSTMLTTYFTSVEAQLTRCFAQLNFHNHIDSEGGTTTPPLTPTVWTQLTKPLIKYTTGAIPNLYMNRIVVGLPSEGPVFTGWRRQAILPLTLVPTVPPIFSTTI